MGIVRGTRRGRIGLLGLLLSLPLTLGFAPAGIEPAASGLGPEPFPIVERGDLVDDVLGLTNRDRAAAGLDALALDVRLSRYALHHSRRMAEYGYLFHSRDEQLKRALEGARWAEGGENVGVGASVSTIQRAFLTSPSHRDNVLKVRFERAAVGVVEADGVLWITVIFYGA
jgi:uncharacterized protein YkwD